MKKLNILQPMAKFFSLCGLVCAVLSLVSNVWVIQPHRTSDGKSVTFGLFKRCVQANDVNVTNGKRLFTACRLHSPSLPGYHVLKLMVCALILNAIFSILFIIMGDIKDRLRFIFLTQFINIFMMVLCLITFPLLWQDWFSLECFYLNRNNGTCKIGEGYVSIILGVGFNIASLAILLLARYNHLLRVADKFEMYESHSEALLLTELI